jgi:hypothetical protein
MEHALAGTKGGTGIVTKTTPARLILEIDIRKRLAPVVADRSD